MTAFDCIAVPKIMIVTLIWSLIAAVQAMNYTVGHRFSTLEDMRGIDREMIQSLLPLLEPNHRAQFCRQNNVPKGTFHRIDSKYIDQLVSQPLLHGGLGIVSPARKRSTALLTKAALTLPEGDIVETGTFIGTSAAIIMNILKDADNCDRKLWAFDSFEGLPEPTMEDGTQGIQGGFRATEDLFKANMESLGLLDMSRLEITKGWFSSTCKTSKVERIAFLRLDGDLFSSTWDALAALYDRVVPGGFIYVDDYGSFVGCRKAIDKFRSEMHIYEPLHYIRENDADSRQIIFEAVWWMKRR